MASHKARFPALYIPHGGGPCFFMTWSMGPVDTWQRMGEWLQQAGSFGGETPAAIVVVSAHWEAPVATVTSGPAPGLIYDYYGFPAHTYELTYPAPGDPALAARVRNCLDDAGIASAPDPERGFDHGVFIPFKLMYPEASIPIVQLSLLASLDPMQHIDIGRALAPLRNEGVLIVGSGMSYHNLPRMMGGGTAIGASEDFDGWLQSTCALDAQTREEQLCSWESAPSAREAHPREEHLLPLMVAAGAGGAGSGRREFTDRVMGATVSAFAFE